MKKNFQLLSSFSKDIYLIAGNNEKCVQEEVFQQTLEGQKYTLVGKGDIQQTLGEIYKRKDLKNKTVLIFGSFFIMEEVRAFFRFKDQRDNLFFNSYQLKK